MDEDIRKSSRNAKDLRQKYKSYCVKIDVFWFGQILSQTYYDAMTGLKDFLKTKETRSDKDDCLKHIEECKEKLLVILDNN